MSSVVTEVWSGFFHGRAAYYAAASSLRHHSGVPRDLERTIPLASSLAVSN